MTDAPGAGAASVAAQLLEFLREPGRVRPLYLHGQEPLPEGHVVLKFALARFSPGWRRDLSHHDQDEIVEAARAFVRQVCLRDRATHYQVLCLDPDAGREEIKENYRLLMALIHPDRQDAAAHEWPTGCAQRVNEAYAVLTDDARRAEYAQDLDKVHVPPSFEQFAASHGMGAARSRRRPLLRPILVVTSVAAALVVVQAWWVSDVPSHYSLLEHASSVRASAQWVRDALPGLPRFMGTKNAFEFEPIELLTRSRQPYRLATPALAALEPAPAPAPPAVEPRRAAEPARTPPSLVPSTLPPRDSPGMPLRLAQAASVGASGPAAAAILAGAAAPSIEDIEIMVARVVGYYESGDADGLMSLFDPDDLGFWKGMRVRNAYTDFFRATRQRRLRVDRLSWSSAPGSAAARGDATLVADYVDSRARLERKVALELDVAMRNGQPRLTRLSLFPEAQ